MANPDRGYGPLCNHMYMYDLGWLVETILSFREELDTAIDLKTIHYADPIQWDITTQYSPNTVVVDPKTGTAYMSKIPVPAGIQLDNTDYWVVIFNYQRIYDKIMSGVAFNDKENAEASKDISKYDFVWYGGDLYQAQRDIPQGSKYVPGVNIVAATIADALATYYGRDRVAQVINDTLTASETQTIGAKNRIINVTGDQTVTAGDIAETSANRTIKTTADYHIDVDGNLSDHVDGVTTVNRGGAVTKAYGSSLDVGVTGTYTADYHGTATDNSDGKRIFNAKDIVLNPTNPLTYGTPEKSEYFGTVPMKSKNGETYNLLTEIPETSDLVNAVSPLFKYPIGGASMSPFYSFHYPNTEPSVVQGMTVYNGNIVMILWKSDDHAKIVIKSLTSGNTLRESEILAIGHGNSAEVYNNKIYIASNKTVYIVDYDTLTLDRSFQLSPAGKLILGSVFFVNDDLIGEVWDGTVFKLIKINPVNGTYELFLNLNPQPFTQTIQGCKYYNGYYYVTAYIPSTIIIYDKNGNMVNYTLLPKMVEGNIYNELEDIGFSGNDIILAFHNDSRTEGFANFAVIRMENSTRTYQAMDEREIIDAMVWNDVYVTPNAHNVVCNGTKNFPFHSFYEAISFIKKELGGNGIIYVPDNTTLNNVAIRACNVQINGNNTTINGLEAINSNVVIKNCKINIAESGIENSSLALSGCTMTISTKFSLYNSKLTSDTPISGALYVNSTSILHADLRHNGVDMTTNQINSFTITSIVEVGTTILSFTRKPVMLKTTLHTGVQNVPLVVVFGEDIEDITGHASYIHNDNLYDIYAYFTLQNNRLIYSGCDTYETKPNGERAKFNYNTTQYKPRFYTGYVSF